MVRAQQLHRNAAMLLAGAAGACTLPAAHAEMAFGVTLQQLLVGFDTNDPTNLLSDVAITGLQSTETVQGIDFRPATGQLYALGSLGGLYTLNSTTGAATAVPGTIAPTPSGPSFGFDFNPVADAVRVISDSNQNLRINPSTLATTVDGSLAYAAGDGAFGEDPNIVHAAYTNSIAGALSTTLYGIDTERDVLVLQSPPNAGALTTVGMLGFDVTDVGGFDISPATGTAYGALWESGLSSSTLVTIDLSTGVATEIGMVGLIGDGAILTAFAVVPAPGAGGLLGLGALAVVANGRRRKG